MFAASWVFAMGMQMMGHVKRWIKFIMGVSRDNLTENPLARRELPKPSTCQWKEHSNIALEQMSQTKLKKQGDLRCVLYFLTRPKPCNRI